MKSRVLLVEGADDKGVSVAFLQRSTLEVDVVDGHGYEKLRAGLGAQLLVSGRTHLGVVVDADADPAGRWRSIADVVAKYGYTLPVEPDAGGTVAPSPARGLPVLGLWLMPDNSTDGMLEHFVSAMIPGDDLLWPRACAAVSGLSGAARPFPEVHRAKAEIHTWLAWQKEPGRPMGQAITKKFLEGTAPGAASFQAWLGRLFA